MELQQRECGWLEVCVVRELREYCPEVTESGTLHQRGSRFLWRWPRALGGLLTYSLYADIMFDSRVTRFNDMLHHSSSAFTAWLRSRLIPLVLQTNTNLQRLKRSGSLMLMMITISTGSRHWCHWCSTAPSHVPAGSTTDFSVESVKSGLAKMGSGNHQGNPYGGLEAPGIKMNTVSTPQFHS